jgi:hypothetical protein
MTEPKNYVKFFRRKYLIYPELQFALIIANLVVMLGVLIAVFVSVSHSYSKLKADGAALGLPAHHSYFRFVDLQSQTVYRSLAVALAVACVVSTIATLVLSNRMAGPIVRLIEYFKGIAAGQEVKPLRFRKRDFFRDLPDQVNQALDALQARGSKK